jgi:hypothetical protein
VGLSFKGVTQYDLRNLLAGSSFIPPDTMGAVGASSWGTWIASINVAAVAVPEPESLPLLIAGLLALGATVRRKAKPTTR